MPDGKELKIGQRWSRSFEKSLVIIEVVGPILSKDAYGKILQIISGTGFDVGERYFFIFITNRYSGIEYVYLEGQDKP